MSDKKAIVIGVGPEAGLGAKLAERFASLGLHVFVAGRTARALDQVVGSITEQRRRGQPRSSTDATDEAAVVALFERGGSGARRADRPRDLQRRQQYARAGSSR